MKESLESARNISQILIVSCTAVVIFSISIIPQKNPYSSALTELNSYEDTLKSFMAKKKILFKYDSSLVIYTEQEIGYAQQEDSLIKAATIEVKAHKNRLDDRVRKEHNARLKYIGDLNQARDSAARDSNYSDVNYYDSLIHRQRGEYLTSIENTLRPDYVALGELNYKPRWKLPPSPSYDSEKVKLAELQKFSIDYMKNALFDSLIREVPSFVYFYDANQESNIKNIKHVLIEEAAKFRNKPSDEVDISGIRVAAKNMYKIAPFIILALMIYLITLIIHIESILNWTEHLSVAEEFPWLAIFRNQFSDWVASLAIGIFPMVTCFFLVAASDIGPFTKRNWLCVYGILFIIVWLFLDKELTKLNSRIHNRPFVPRSRID